MMAWIKLETHTFEKVEIFSMAQELNIDPDAVVGKCARVWAWFDLNTVDGVTPIVTEALLDRYCGLKGFCKAMVKVGWMGINEQSLFLPNYDRHNSQTAKDRALTSKRVSKFRKNLSSNGISNDKSNELCNATALAESLDREDKIRKDIYTDNFEKFWKEYPSKVGKGGAFNSWKKIKVNDDLLEKILKAITLYKQTKQVKDGYIKNPQTWLNNRCWEDEVVLSTNQTTDFWESLRVK
jgi:hypothetical protein